MSDKLPKNHSASAHKDKVGQVMHEFKRGQLHSGTGKKGKKGPVVKSKAQALAIALAQHAETFKSLGFAEENIRDALRYIAYSEVNRVKKSAMLGKSGGTF